MINSYYLKRHIWLSSRYKATVVEMKKITREIKRDQFRLVFFIEDVATINTDDERSLTKQPVFFFFVF